MKSLYTLSFLLLSILSVNFANAQSAEKTLVKSFNLKGMNVVTLNLPGEVEVQQWNNPIMRVQMTIGIENVREATLKSLVKAGRYNLQSKEGEEEYEISAPGMNRTVKIGGQELRENISYIVYAPEDVMVKLADSSSANLTQ